MSYFTEQNWLIVPSLLLTVSGITLFRRDRTPASALVAIGFAAVLFAGISQAIAYYELSQLYNGSRTLSAADVKPYGWALMLARWGRFGGAWVAGVGFLWHVLKPPRVS